jgi:hypothetical protein
MGKFEKQLEIFSQKCKKSEDKDENVRISAVLILA